MDEKNTIAAIATPAGPGGIAIVRVSGPKAELVAGRLFRPARGEFPLQSHRMYYGRILDPVTGRNVDEALCCYMKAPWTYTRQDVTEFHCHGGPVMAGLVLNLVLDCGAELARPGEFTRRAFLAGRMDLSQAEAVAELIGARGRVEAELAANQLLGGLKDRIEKIGRSLIQVLARLEAALDFPDEEIEIIGPDSFARLDQARLDLEALLAAYEDGRVYRESLQAALVGRPNVGKSSLLNALARAEKAIVTDQPGTTRDVIEAEIMLEGLPLTLVDTAGLGRRPRDEAEEIGQRRAEARLSRSDLVLLILDLSRPLDEEDRRIFQAVPADRTVMVLNKNDLKACFTEGEALAWLGQAPVARISALTGQGLTELVRLIAGRIRQGAGRSGAIPEIVPNLRHKKALETAKVPLARALRGVEQGLAPELLALELRQALDGLGAVTGRNVTEDVLDEIFSRFCLGK
ncbi:MAG: tRNA uridine-5-carboxymethylaminomethyl(34) synthesis GTPase MnmE [Thermodesulfobacteriota bacterium]